MSQGSCIIYLGNQSEFRHCTALYAVVRIPSAGIFRPTVIDKSWPIGSMGLRLRDHTRTFDSGIRARSASRWTLPAEGIDGTVIGRCNNAMGTTPATY